MNAFKEISLRILAISSLTLALSACGGDGSSNPTTQSGSAGSAQTGATPAVGSNGYSFTDVNDQGQACSTGVKNFDTQYLMCINIQDPVQNDNCATDQRTQKFEHDCEPIGMSYDESHVCTVALIDKNADVSSTGDYDKKYRIQKVSYCAGRAANGMQIGGVSDNGKFYENLVEWVDMEFVPRQKWEANNKSSFSFTLAEVSEGNANKVLIDNFEYNDGNVTKVGQTLDGQYRYVIQCNNTWACDPTESAIAN